MKTPKDYVDQRIANGGRSVLVLLELAKAGLTMHDGMHFSRVARACFTTPDNTAKTAERHNELLEFVKDQAEQILELRLQLAALKSQASQGIGGNLVLQPWQMTTPEFKAHLKETWVDPFAKDDDVVDFGTPIEDSPLCGLPLDFKSFP